MAIKYAGGAISAITEIPEILEAGIMQTKQNGGAILAATEIPEITSLGLSTYVLGEINSSAALTATSSRLRTRGAAISAASEILEISQVAVLPEKFISAGQVTYNGQRLNKTSITKGSYLPLAFEVSGDRLIADMDVIFSVQKINDEQLFEKRVRLGVFDDNIVTLPDGRDSISGTIAVLPSDTENIPGNSVEIKYHLRLANLNIRNYYLESGFFILKK